MDVTALGLAAGALTSMAAVPQLARTLRTRHARDISVWQPLLLTVGVALWMLYGILIHDLPLILSNIVPLACNALLVWLKLKYRDDDA